MALVGTVFQMAYAGSCGTDNILAAVPTILKWGIQTAFALPAVSSMWTVLILLAGVIGFAVEARILLRQEVRA